MLTRRRGEIPVPADTAEDSYRIEPTVLSPDTEDALAVNWLRGGRTMTLAPVSVGAWPLQTEFPPIATPRRAVFGDPTSIELYGYRPEGREPAPGETGSLTLYWRSTATMNSGYRVFVHLTNEAE